jgi:hypothetical protein
MFLAKPNERFSNSTTMTAPIGGLNAFNPVSSMPENDAIVMRDFYPEPFGVRVRKGYAEHAVGMNGDVCSLMTYNGIDGTATLFAVDQTNIWDITLGGNIAGDTPFCESSFPYWQYTNMANAAGVSLIAFNGRDDGVWWNGTTLTRLIFGDGIVPGTWSGVNPADLIQPLVHKHRLWAVEKNTTQAWYLPPEQIFGAATRFDFGANFSRGGFLQVICTYTLDSGEGPNDYFIAISSEGEAVLYNGIDPSDATDWALVGVFYIGPTFSRRCTTKFGGDIAILTQYGMVTMNSVMKPASDSVLNNALSQKIQYLLSGLIADGSYRPGWEIASYSTENFMFINVPGVVPQNTLQLVYNTLTKAWTMFTGHQANCWGTSKDALWFGANGVVYRAWYGNYDGTKIDGTPGDAIVAECQQAFSYFGTPGLNKHYKMFSPTFSYGGKFKYRASANMAFNFTTLPAPAPLGESDAGIWDTSLWDSDAVWSGGAESDKQWVSITGVAYAAAIRVMIETNTPVTWISTDWLLEKGGVV